MANKVTPPCTRECPLRSAECHSVCGAWLAYEAERNKAYEQKKKDKAFNQWLNDIDNRRSTNVHNWRNGRKRGER